MAEQPSKQPDHVWTEGDTFRPDIIYNMKSPDGKQDLIMMLDATWFTNGTFIKQCQLTLASQDKRIKELLQQVADLHQVNEDLAGRLDTLRANHRKIIAAKVDQQMSDLGYLSPPTT